jgi:DNA-directed RNA polymerase sigma subunit (sigma70/sigma32)
MCSAGGLLTVSAPVHQRPAHVDRTRRLIRAAQAGDLEARNRLIVLYLPLVAKLARGFRDTRVDRADLVQAGALGLIEAIDHFRFPVEDPEHFNFGGYAQLWVWKAMRAERAEAGSFIRITRHRRESIGA